jgi:hypothetical protein
MRRIATSDEMLSCGGALPSGFLRGKIKGKRFRKHTNTREASAPASTQGVLAPLVPIESSLSLLASFFPLGLAFTVRWRADTPLSGRNGAVSPRCLCLAWPPLFAFSQFLFCHRYSFLLSPLLSRASSRRLRPALPSRIATRTCPAPR